MPALDRKILNRVDQLGEQRCFRLQPFRINHASCLFSATARTDPRRKSAVPMSMVQRQSRSIKVSARQFLAKTLRSIATNGNSSVFQ